MEHLPQGRAERARRSISQNKQQTSSGRVNKYPAAFLKSKKEWRLPYEQRELSVPPGLLAGERRLRHRHRQCLAFPLCDRRLRRRRVRFVLLPVPDHHGCACADHGAGRGPGQPQERRPRLQGPGKAGQQVAYPRLVLRAGLLSSDDVLYHCFRLDAQLLLQVRRRHLLRHGDRRR